MFGSRSKGTELSVELVPGKIAPRYVADEWTELVPTKAIITEKGTTKDLPLVDIQMVDAEGRKFYFMLTGRLFNVISAAIKGVNMRNHGVEEP